MNYEQYKLLKKIKSKNQSKFLSVLACNCFSLNEYESFENNLNA